MQQRKRRAAIGCKEFHEGLKKMLGDRAPSYRAFRPMWAGITKIVEVSLLQGYVVQFLKTLSVWYEDIPAKEPRETVFGGKVIMTKAKPARRKLRAEAKGVVHKTILEETKRARKLMEEMNPRTPEEKAEAIRNYPLRKKKK